MKATTPATVHFLDGETHTFHIDVRCRTQPSARNLTSHQVDFDFLLFLQKHAKGQCLIDLVLDHLDLVERDYFGLQFLESEYEIAQDLIIWVRSNFVSSSHKYSPDIRKTE